VWNAHAHAVDLAVDEEQDALRAAAEAAAAPDRAAAAALEPELHAALARAAELTGLAGRSFDPAAPSEADLLRVEPRSLPELAAELRLPDPEGDRRSHLRRWLAAGFTVGVGVLIGLSVGLMAGFIHADSLQRQVPVLIPVLGLGCVAAFWMSRAVWAAHREASQRGSLGRPVRERWAPVAAALGTDLLVLAVEVVVEREGILRLARLEEAVGALSNLGRSDSGGDWVWWVAPLVVSLGFVLSHAWEGHVAGRIEAVTNRLLLAQAEDLRPRVEQHHARPEVREALAAILARAPGAARRLAARAAEAEGRRIEPRPDFTPEQLRRIQDAMDDVNGPNHLFHVVLWAEVRRLNRRLWSWWGPRLQGRLRGRR
jgi:hypothetical protein